MLSMKRKCAMAGLLKTYGFLQKVFRLLGFLGFNV